MSRKTIFAGSLATLMGLGMVATAFAQSSPSAMRGVPGPSINVQENGHILVRGAKVTGISGDTINVSLSWGVLTWNMQVKTDSSTHFVQRNGGNGSLAIIEVGHIISFQGMVDATSATPLVNARVVRNWSLQKIQISPFGIIESINSSAKTFVLKTEERGTPTVNVLSTTKILKTKATSSFDALTVGMRVGVKGAWDRAANTIDAEQIKIHMEDRKVLPNGKVKAVATSSTSSFTAEFGGKDYKVNIAADTAVINKLWLKIPLTSFQVGDHVRVYGVVDGNEIDATVVRNVSR